MRLINRYSQFWPRHDEGHLRDLLRVEHLAGARLEPVYSMRYEAYLDLLFESGGRWLVLPMLRADGVSVMAPEVPPLSWPAYLSDVGAPVAGAIEEQVVPWLRSIAMSRMVNDEIVRFFRDDRHLVEDFERARSRSLLGSAPYADVLRTLGPAIYAQRFAHDARIALCGDAAANGAAVLSALTRDIAWTTCDESIDALARRWFAGIPCAAASQADYDLYVGPRDGACVARAAIFTDGEARDGERVVVQVEAIPVDVMVSFDPEDAPPLRSFTVSETSVPLRISRVVEPNRGGGSSGRIALVVRDDAERMPDADTDAAHELMRALRAEGFDASVTIASTVDPAKTDVIHVFDLRHGAALVELLRDAERLRTPVIVTPYADDRRGEAAPGASGSLLIPRNTSDTVSFSEYARAFAARRITNLTETPWYTEVARVLLARASAAIVASPAEGNFLRERFGFERSTVPVAATIPLVRPSDGIAALVGHEEFVLVHAPIEPRANQLFTALAAQRYDLPLLLVGPIADVEYHRYLNEIVGPRTIQLRDHDLTPEELAGLYARARVVADVGWSSRGLHRLARGAATGATVVANLTGYAHDLWGDVLTLADPASLDGIAEALRLAWEAQPRLGAAVAARTAERCDPFAGLVATVSAYRQASVPAAS